MDTSQKRKLIYQLLAKKGILGQKQALLDAYGVDSTKSLTEDQLDEIISSLSKDSDAQQIKRWRSNVLCTLQRIGIYKTNESWESVNNFLLSPKIAGKLMYDMDLTELKELNKKLLNILKKQTIKKENERIIAKMN